jgi:hypothetical protein
MSMTPGTPEIAFLVGIRTARVTCPGFVPGAEGGLFVFDLQLDIDPALVLAKGSPSVHRCLF